jgi:hypothetical protein
LAELRDLQRGINDANAALAIWEKLTSDEQIRNALGHMDSRRTMAGFGLYSAVEKSEVSPADARQQAIAKATLVATGPNRKRWIEHVLNRLAFERSMLGDVPRYAGEITPVILQALMREHGAEKPKATEIEPGSFQVESDLPLPAHISGETYLELDSDGWRDLMQDCGYIVPEKKERRASSKPAPLPLINPTPEQAEKLQTLWNLQMVRACQKQRHANAEENQVKALSQARYSANAKGTYSPLSTIDIAADGREVRGGWRGGQWVLSGEAVARVRVFSDGSGFYKPRAVVHIDDKPAKALPFDLDGLIAAVALEIEHAGQDIAA